MNIKEQREILEAYENGEEIKGKPRNGGKEFIIQCDDYRFNFQDNDYKINPKRWRAEKGEQYYYVSSCCSAEETVESNYSVDNNHYKVGNYFSTMEDAEKVKDLIKEVLVKFHEENG